MEKLNIAEILKDCPEGTKLYSPIFGEVELEKVLYTSIIVKGKSGMWADFYVDGKYHSNGECMLFPSKENKDWSTFKRPFKDGDVVYIQSLYKYIAIYKKTNCKNLYKHAAICITFNNRFLQDINILCCEEDVKKIRLATEEEKQKLFDAIKANGYKWNPETKTLEKLPKFKVGDRIKHKDTGIYCNFGEYIESLKGYRTNIGLLIRCDDIDDWELVPNKFDITTLEPFESKVLVRTSNHKKWVAAFYSHYDKDSLLHHCVVGGLWYEQCVPYNGNEHLLDTTNDCDEYYKTWE